MPGITVNGRRFECKLVIFDLDGTLIDERKRFLNLAGARVRAMREFLGEDFVGEWARLSGVDLNKGSIDMSGPLARASRRDDLAVAATAIWLHGMKWSEARRVAEEIYNRADGMLADDKGEALIAGAGDALKRLKRAGLKLAIATNETRKAAEKVMSSLGVKEQFDFFVGADDVQNPKPAADMVLMACEGCGCNPSKAAMIGDQPADLTAGRRASLGVVVAVRSPTVAESEVKDLADAVIDSVAELETF